MKIDIKKIIEKIMNFIIYILKFTIPIASFCLAINFAFMDDKPVQMLAFIATGFLFLFMFFIKELGFFESINIAGLDIKLRQAKEILKELKLIAKEFSSITLENVQRELRGEDYGFKDHERIYKKINNLLKLCDLSEEEIKNLQEENWHKWVYKNYTSIIFDSFRINTNSDFYKNFYANWSKNKPYIIPDEIKKLSEKYNDLEISVDKNYYDELLLDYEFYINNKIHRDNKRWTKNIRFKVNSAYKN